MSRWNADANGVVAITATCGTDVVTVPITVYQITGVSAAGSLVAVGDPANPLSFTATIDPPGGTPPPIEWFVNGVWQGITATGATFAPASLAPGYHTVSAKMGSSEVYTGATVVGIGSVSMSGPDYNGPVPAGEVRYIYQNDTYTFTATATPEGAAWPLNQPQWTINGTTTTGSNAPGTFGTLSTSISNFKTAVASCGTSSMTVNAVVYKCDLTMVPDDNFEGRSQSEFGIGEVIYVTNSITPSDLSMAAAGLSWGTNFPYPAVFEDTSASPSTSGFTASASVSASGASSGTPAPVLPAGVSVFKFKGFDPGTYSVWIRLPGEPAWNNAPPVNRPPGAISLPLIAPTEARYVKPSVPVETDLTWADFGINPAPFAGNVKAGPAPIHFQGTLTCHQGFNVWLKPENVSWYGIQFREGECGIQQTGAFVPTQPGVDPDEQASRTIQHVPIPAQSVLRGIAGKGCKVDWVDVSGFSLPTRVRGFSGSADCAIPLEYKVFDTSVPTQVWRSLGTVNSHKEISRDGGDMSGKKQDESYQIQFNSPSNFYP